MGESIIVVNQTKRQYFSPSAFYENDKVQNTLGEIHGRALGLLLLDEYGEKTGLAGSWYGDSIAILGEVRSAGSERDDEYYKIHEEFEDIGKKLLATVFERLHFTRDELVKRAQEYEGFFPYFKESALNYGGVNMKHSLKTKFNQEKT